MNWEAEGSGKALPGAGSLLVLEVAEEIWGEVRRLSELGDSIISIRL